MNLGELITLYRAQAQDKEEPYFASDELLTVYANQAQDEACRRGDLLVDSSSRLCRVEFKAGDDSIRLDRRIVLVKKAWCMGDQICIQDEHRFGDWRGANASGRPQALIAGADSGRLHFWPHPATDGVVELTVRRLPMRPMESDDDEPEIRPELHDALVNWMLYRVYSITDAETFNPQKAAQALAEFESEFGKRTGGRNEWWVREGNGLMPSPIA